MASDGLAGGDIRAFTKNGNNFFVSTGGAGVFVSTNDGNSWNYTGLSNHWVYSMTSGPDGSGGSYVYAGTMGEGIYRSSDNGANWTPVSNGITVPLIWYLLAMPNGSGGTILYAGTYGGGVFISTNNGDSWNATGFVPGAPLITSIIVDGSNIFAASWSSGVFLSTDNGTSWIPVTAGLGNTFVNALFMDGTNLYAGTLDGIYLSTNNGTNWTPVNNGIPANSSVYAFIKNGDALIAGLGSSSINPGGVFMSTNNGTSWVAKSEGLINTNLRCFVIDNGFLFAGTYGGGLWQRPVSEVPVELASFNAEISGNDVILNWRTSTETNNRGFEIQRSEIRSQKSDWKAVGYVGGFGTTTEPKSYSFTDNNVTSGKYSYRLKQVDFDGSYKYSNIVEVEVNSVSEFALSQNYPNPFNPTTKISYTLPKDEFVSLKVYNSLGQEVANLVNGMSKAGSHEVTFSAANLSSGIYYYRIEAGGNVSVKKMILMK
jgi:photosystem II stability/assembly factor-like uncharacterized protein